MFVVEELGGGGEGEGGEAEGRRRFLLGERVLMGC